MRFHHHFYLNIKNRHLLLNLKIPTPPNSQEDMSGSICSKMCSCGKFVKKAIHLGSCVQRTSNDRKSDVAKFATCSEPI